MTNDSLDRMIRQALLAAAEADCQQVMAQTTEELSPSPAYQRWTRRFLKNPLAELRRTRRPVWKRVMRSAACILLILSLSFGTLMAVSPDARAWVIKWFAQEHSTHVSYEYTEEVPVEKLGKWVPTYLPEGYTQTDFIDLGNQVVVNFNNHDPERKITLNYHLMSEGGGFGLDNEHHEISNITISNMPGQLFTAKNNGPNMLVWFNENAQHAFLLVSKIDCDTLLRIAESVEPVN